MDAGIEVVILARGRSFKLETLITKDCPKPLLPVANRPLLSYQIKELGAAGIRSLFSLFFSFFFCVLIVLYASHNIQTLLLLAFPVIVILILSRSAWKSVTWISLKMTSSVFLSWSCLQLPTRLLA